MKTNNPVMIALDGGGTKTDAIMFDGSGHIIHRIIRKGCTPVDIGIEAAKDAYIDIVKALAIEADYSGRINTIYASIATADYFGRALQNGFDSSLVADKIRVEEDGPSLISGMLGHRDGCSLICGTGSALYVRTGDKYYHLGGGGYLIDSFGSGYVLGKLALRAAFRSKEGWEEPTLLVRLIEEQCGETLLEHYTKLYTQGRAHIASFANTVFEARNMGDEVARRIFDYCAGDMAKVVWCVYKKLGHPYDLVYNGGIFFNHREYAEAVRALSPACINSIFSDVRPIYGAAVEAMHDASCPVTADFKETFLREYDRYL